ncbi:triple tyrosine motif-containing protein [Yeosuana sp. MJ-SS3]|uniref:Triple tyrosine motif-containing protein n=1 Tax=Gilvirhabdus luticola TaxID=3079858 RepID=A0ABU3U5N0_9FLAO|nr:triple tyrosine motif-containing protein [Yeosuana sp. MJ-SS3]MDU8885666.1 triple tyrosine motif-containing protein [Yeosuana sp. MJ-SS3]
MLRCFRYNVVVFFFLSLYIFGQEIPPIEIFSPEIYGAENQNWSITQAGNKYIYVANNKGLLEFNGAEWKFYDSPNETIMRSVNVIDDKIYTGCYREFGYWQPTVSGELAYTSLSQNLSIPFLDDEEIWNIIKLDRWILFQSLKRIYIYNNRDNSYSFIDSQASKIFKLSDGIYFQKTNEGLYKIENGKLKQIISDPVLSKNLLVNMFDINDGYLLQTQDAGFYKLRNNKITKWDIPANEILSSVSVYNSMQLQDSSFILGTISDGMLHLTPNGEINYDINRSNGLGNNTVLSIFEDIENNIWLGLDNGINCINIKSPFKVYNDNIGTIGTVYASAVYENKVYLGTNQGLFYKALLGNKQFQFVKGTQGQVWCLVEIDNTLFCGHNTGTFIIKDSNAEKILDISGTWNIKSIDRNNNLLIQGNYNGLNVLEKQNGKWRFKNKIEGFDISSKYFEILKERNQIFVSHEYKGVFNLTVDKDYRKVLDYKIESSVARGLNSSLVKYNSDILYAYRDGVFKFYASEGVFKKDSLYSQIFNKNEYTSGKLVNENKTNTLWSFSANGLSYITQGKFLGEPEIKRISFPIELRKDVTDSENITHIIDNQYLIGTSSGYIMLDLNNFQERKYNIAISTVGINKYKSQDSLKLIDKNAFGDFKSNQNNIQFSFSIPEYQKYYKTEYQYKLEGIYNNWSDWSINSIEKFENLPFGDYTFKVRGRSAYINSDNTAEYSFIIARPWFLSNTAIIFYILIVSLFSLFMHNVYKRYYRKQREKLLEKTTKELELIKLENQQQLMQFNNEKLRQDIEYKDRELNISTMSLIKKNEFLNNIKSELKKIENVSNLKGVIKIIDKNLNHSDDWNVFEQAFNNADKDFLKKMKSIHPNLTHNDLRLCAYLRLNLSSKEIAPLLNISSRSVEVKRYRLRKKIDLPHEESLTDYILEI